MQNCKIKKHYRKQFTQIDNSFINDMQLSFQAKGVFLYLWSKPDDWSVNVKAMQHECIDKQTKIYSSLTELEDKGYLARKRYYINGKVAGINYNLSDTKEFFFNEEEFNEENLNQGNLNEENLDEYIYTKKDNTKKDNTKKEETASGSSLSQNQDVKGNLTTQSSYSVIPNNLPSKQYEKDFEEFYEAYEGKHPSKQPKRAQAVYTKWKLAVKTHPPQAILKAIQDYAEYLSLATWRKKKDAIAWLNGAMYEVDWKEEALQEEQKLNKTTFSKQDAKPTLRESINANREQIRSLDVSKYL